MQKQMAKYDCGLACLYNLSKVNALYEDFCKIHYNEQPLSLYDLQKILENYQGKASFFEANYEELLNLKDEDVILFIYQNNVSHAVILKRISKKGVDIFCPTVGDIFLTHQYAKKVFLNKLMVIEEQPKISLRQNININAIYAHIIIHGVPLAIFFIEKQKLPYMIALALIIICFLIFINFNFKINKKTCKFLLVIFLLFISLWIFYWWKEIFWKRILYFSFLPIGVIFIKFVNTKILWIAMMVIISSFTILLRINFYNYFLIYLYMVSSIFFVNYHLD